MSGSGPHTLTWFQDKPGLTVHTVVLVILTGVSEDQTCDLSTATGVKVVQFVDRHGGDVVGLLGKIYTSGLTSSSKTNAGKSR